MVAIPRAFVSFAMEDRWGRDFLVEHAHQRNNAIGFVDYSVHEPFDERWRTQCRVRIARTAGTIVLVGQTTAKSPAVAWEIAETIRLGHPGFGIQINRDMNWALPVGLPASRVVRWDFGAIVAELGRWA